MIIYTQIILFDFLLHKFLFIPSYANKEMALFQQLQQQRYYPDVCFL